MSYPTCSHRSSAGVLLKLVRGKARSIHWLMYVIALMFVAYFLRGAVEGLLL